MFQTFIRATADYCTLDSFVPAPYFRHSFAVHGKPQSAVLYITGLGFYEAHINGTDITKGILAPYIGNPQDFVYYDRYDITEQLCIGKNVLFAVLGNGFQNPLGGYIWDFDTAPWRGAPLFSFKIEITYKNGERETVEPSAETKTAPSPILFDDVRHGEIYDARLETENVDRPEFDDTAWRQAIVCAPPKGEQRLCEADPIVKIREIKPVCIREHDGGFIYDFGENFAGLCKLRLKNTERGKEIVLRHFETTVDGFPYYNNINFASQNPKSADYQRNIYYCRGADSEEHLPRFTYDGFRFVYITGITRQQATADALTYVVYSSADKTNGSFSCDNRIINQIQAATVRSDISNLYYFPTDCPQREKNGWTADAALSCEQMLLNLYPENCYKEWLRNICKAMSPEGALPGIVPTAGWGFEWGNGPAWDQALITIPYYTYLYKGDKGILAESAEFINRYIHYLNTRLDERNLLAIGLGDWCQPGKLPWEFETPLAVTDTLVSVDIARKAQFIFEALGLSAYRDTAAALEQTLTKAFRENLIDKNTLWVQGKTQTAQALGLYYGMFEADEYAKALENLLEKIREKDNHCYCGVIGAEPFYRVLAENGLVDLAVDIITDPQAPGYGNWIARGSTTLRETFAGEGDKLDSLNHHFWGFISTWFYRYIAGIVINPNRNNENEAVINPRFAARLSESHAEYKTPCGRVATAWHRTASGIMLYAEISSGVTAKIVLPAGYAFCDGTTERVLAANKPVRAEVKALSGGEKRHG